MLRAELAAIAQRRGVTIDVAETQRTRRRRLLAARSQALFAQAIAARGISRASCRAAPATTR